MKKRMKKILAFMLAASMTATMVPGAVFAEESTQTAENAQSSTSSRTADDLYRTLHYAAQLAKAEFGEESPAVQSDEGVNARRSAESRSIDWEALKADLYNEMFVQEGGNAVSLSEYDLEEAEAQAAVDEVIAENSAENYVETEIITGNDGKVDGVTYSMDPEMKALTAELNEIEVKGDDGSGYPTPLTDEQKQKILELYAGYKQVLINNPDVYGLQTPFFLLKEDEASASGNSLAPLASMLVLINNGQDASQQITMNNIDYIDYDTLYGMVYMFYQAYDTGVQYKDAIVAAKNQALAKVDASMSTEQKLLVLTDWLANYANFDMASLMGMTAPDDAGKQLTEQQQFEQQITQLQGSTIIGILGRKMGVCVGYSHSLIYLVQNTFTDIYKNSDGSWKKAEDVNYIKKEVPAVDSEGNPVVDEEGNQSMVTEMEWSSDAPYMIDYTRIVFDAGVTMFGEEQEKFDSDHYWNAVRVNGKWYYLDACYSDIYIECMARDRVETDGNMNHMYFLISHDTINSMYDGYFSQIDSPYASLATDKSYESAWINFVKSPVSYVDGKYYYFYNSMDFIDMMQYKQMMNSNMGNMGDMMGDREDDTEYALVYRNANVADTKDTADQITKLVDFNNGTVLNPSTGAMVENALIKELYAEHQVYRKLYPSIDISGSVYNGVFYFNISNCILSYNLSTGEVKKIKEYNEVSAKRDTSVALGGMAFNIVSDPSKADITLKDKPVASMTIKDDGKMYVSVATNLGWISGKENMNDESSNGYEFEETNYTPGYSQYFNFNDETNDNDEFMWSAVLKETLDMSHITGGSHSYKAVTVAPGCETKGYTENRCTTCGMSDGAEPTNITEPTGHHFIHVNETYYTKDSNGNFNTGETNVCVGCLLAEDELSEGHELTKHTYTSEPEFQWAEDGSSCKAVFKCTECENEPVDCVQGNVAEETVDCKVDVKYPDGYKCEKGGKVTCTATVEKDGKEWTNSGEFQKKAGEHVPVYASNGDFTHSADCQICGAKAVENETCTFKDGKCTLCGAEAPSVTYRSHVQDHGDMAWVSDGELSGTHDESRRMEAIWVKLDGAPEGSGIKYQTHVQNKGWMNWVSDGKMSGTSGESLRTEAMRIELTGKAAELFDVYYRVHVQNFGWLDWAKNGEEAGSAGWGYRMEAFEVVLKGKGEAAPGATENPYEETLVKYSVHVQDYGDQAERHDGALAGTTGESKRLEAIKILLPTNNGKSAIQYRTHIQDIGWQGWKSNGGMSGTSGKSKRLEAIEIKLTGEMAEKYDVYYCVHAQSYGWLGWAKNGEQAGTEGFSYRLEGIRIVLVEKGGAAPAPVEGTNLNSFYKK